MELNEVLNQIVRAERKCGEFLLQARDILIEEKGSSRNIVTQYDIRVQEYLMEVFSGQFPGAHFFCEEMEHPESLEAEEVFIIDPIDGTMNFSRRMNHSCISVAYARKGDVVCAAVYNPFVNELYTAIRNQGAFLNGLPIRAESCDLANSLILIGTSPYSEELNEKTTELIRFSLDKGLDIRRQGSAELDLCSLAAGKAGLYCEFSLSLWDYAAGVLIAEEAGAVCRNAEGLPLLYSPGKSSILAGSPKAVEEFLAKKPF